MSAVLQTIVNVEQGSPEWLALRKTKITATDASIIMGASHWKTKIQLYHEKKSDAPPSPPTEKMKRGIDLEPIARELFTIKTGILVQPQVVVKDWAMASLDGMSECGKYIVEIKCPGEKDHATAMAGKVPDHYYPQLQHQMFVCDVEEMYYFSFDGADGVIVTVKKDEDYIAKMIDEEWKFYECLRNETPPERSESDYLEMFDPTWDECASKWRELTETIERLEKEKEELRKQFIFLSQDSNAKGSGISLCQVTRKGNVVYSKVPELKGVDLEPYRGASIVSWRITCN